MSEPTTAAIVAANHPVSMPMERAALERIERLARAVFGIAGARIILRGENGPTLDRNREAVFFESVALRSSRGEEIGALEIFDSQPRAWDEAEQAQLRDLAVLAEGELRLRRLEDRFAAWMQDGFDLIVVLDESGRVKSVSPSVERQLGYAADAWLGHTTMHLIHPDDRDEVAQQIEKATKNPGLQESFHFRLAHKNGSYRTLEAVGRNCLDDPQIRGIVATARDVTAYLKAEERLLDSEERFQTVFDQTATGMALVALDGRWLRVNDALCRIIGYSQKELRSLDFQAITHPDDLNADLKQVQDLIGGNIQNYEMEKRYRHRDGYYVWALLTVALVRDGNGKPLYFISQVQDISARKAQEERLRLLESVAVNANEAVLIADIEKLDSEGPRVLYVNNAFSTIVGYAPEEVLGQPVNFLYGPETAINEIMTLRDSLQKGLSADGEFVLYRKGEVPFWAEFDVAPVANEQGIVTHWVCHIRDVTERHKAREALHKAKDVAESANVAKSEFLSRMSHELRTPLNAILGFGQLLELAPLEPRDRQCAEQIVKAGSHLLELINEVLDISRIETGRLSLSLEPVGAAEVAREAFELVRPLAATYQVILEGNGFPQQGLAVKADRTRLKQVLLNLLSNAIKYNRPGGTVRLWTEDVANDEEENKSEANTSQQDSPHQGSPRRIRICVSDTGSGIAPDKRERIWMPFDRLGAENDEVEGTGIGLALSKRLAQAMGGQLDFDSNIGQGSTFWIELPLAAMPGRDSRVSSQSETLSALPSTPQHVVVYIEDNVSNIELMQGVMSTRPHVQLLTATDGVSGLRLVRDVQPDLLLLDLHLPKMSGEEVLIELRGDERTSALPVFVISADATPRQKEKLRAAGADAYLTKPFVIKEFLSLLDQSLSQQNSSPERARSKSQSGAIL